MIQPTRIQQLNTRPELQGQYVLYWMQASVRSRYNHALERAVEHAERLGQPLQVVFGLTPSYPEANLRMYTFLLEGLRDVQTALQRRGIPFAVCLGDPAEVALRCGAQASLVVTDRAYLRIQREWRGRVAAELNCPLEQVESDLIVPVQVASDKEEFAARTLRPRLHRLLPEYLHPLGERSYTGAASGPLPSEVDLSDLPRALEHLHPDPSVPPSVLHRGGETEAWRHFEVFLESGLGQYVEGRGGPLSSVSGLSPYLHYGQISALEVALRLEGRDDEAARAYLEELIVRRELSYNFCYYNPGYDDYSRAIPDWARRTLEAHRSDPRPYLYTLEQLERAQTHDPYWNAAQLEMVRSGKMANYLRMYWGKKVLEWTERPEQAFEWLIYLNNKYELDGRNANSYAGISWIFGKHDRPWKEREVFGMVRSLTSSGLERKFDMQAYVAHVARL